MESRGELLEWEGLVARAERWAQTEAHGQEASEVREQVALKDLDSLRVGFGDSLQFGTAGLRGAVGVGPGRMNESTIGRVSWALGEFLQQRKQRGGAPPLVVVGFDARPTSASFARCAVEVLTGLGLRVFVSKEPIPTPLIAFATRQLGASAGVVVTASHNPPSDNGYKVYDGQGVQIVHPWDSQIADLMEHCPNARALKRRGSDTSQLPVAVVDAYFDHVSALAERWVPVVPSVTLLRVAYTPLHGVGSKSVARSLARLPVELVQVPKQAEPDGTFPTLSFPNPEEPGVLDLLLEAASENGCEVALANDPDVDRLACCLPLARASGQATQELSRLSGDALGLLFADLCLRRAESSSPCVVSTVVSTPALDELARHRGGNIERTLTGFKWLCRAALEQPNFVFAYEEALGYCFAGDPGTVGVMDKDGIASLTTLVRLVMAEGGGLALARRLLGLYRELGLWGSYGHSRRYAGENASLLMEARMKSLRNEGLPVLDGFELTERIDFLNGADSRPWYRGRENLLCFDLTRKHGSGTVDRMRILLRPSGTEPKLKAYVHLRSKLLRDEDYPNLVERQRELALEIASQLFGA